MEYRTPNISPTTLNSTYEPVAAHIRKCKINGLKNPLKFRTELLRATTESQVRRSLMQISAACDWGLKHNLIQENPFSGMYLDMLQSKAPPPVALLSRSAIASSQLSSTTAVQAPTTGTTHPSSSSCSGRGAVPVRRLGCVGVVCYPIAAVYISMKASWKFQDVRSDAKRIKQRSSAGLPALII